MSKKVLSLLLALTMILSMTSISAFASESQGIIIIGDSNAATPSTTGGGILTNDEDDDPDALLTCDCVVECTEDAINADCPICATQPELCVVGVNVGVENIMPVGTPTEEAVALLAALNLIESGSAALDLPDNNAGVKVTGDITIENDDAAVIVKEGVTLRIADGGSITIDRTDLTTGIEVQSGGFFTVASGGLLSVSNTNGIGIDLQNGGGSDIGVMELDSTGTVNVQNAGGIGIKVSGFMNVATNNSVVNVSNSVGTGISVDGGDMLVAYNGAVNINNTDPGTTGIGVAAGGTMTVSNNGTVTVNTEATPSAQNKGIEVSGGALNVSGGTVNVDNDGGISTGIYLTSSGTMTVYSGTVNITSSSVSAGINISSSANMNIRGGAVNVSNSVGAGIIVSGPLTFSGGAVNVNNTADSQGIGIGSGTFTLDAITKDVTLTLNGNATSLAGTNVVGNNAATHTAKIVTGATPLNNTYTHIFYSSPTAAASTAAANTDYKWSVITGSTYGWLTGSTPAATETTTTPSSGSSPSKEVKPAPPAPVITPLDDKATGVLSTAINSAANTASSSGKSLDVKLKNVSNFTKANAAAIIAKAKALGKPATVSSDVMSEDGKYVEVRVTVDPTLINKNVRLDGYTRQAQTFITQTMFKKHFENKTAFVHLAQEGKFGQTAKIAAKVDLKDFNAANLFIYSYDKKTSKYTLITSKDYKIDKKGYLHFKTDNGGDIIISDGKLERK